MSSLQVLIGLSVEKIEKVHDYIQIAFFGGAILSIFNKYFYDGDSVLDIQHRKVMAVHESDDKVSIIFDNERSFSVGLKDHDYNGPEAMILMREGKVPIVWS